MRLQVKVSLFLSPSVKVKRFSASCATASENNFILTEKLPDIVISSGGSGMLLSAFHMNTSWGRVAICYLLDAPGFYTNYLDGNR